MTEQTKTPSPAAPEEQELTPSNPEAADAAALDSASSAEAADAPAADGGEQVPADGTEEKPKKKPNNVVILAVGDVDVSALAGQHYNLTPASDAVEDVLAVFTAAELSPSDLRSKVVLHVDPDPKLRVRALAVYATLCGLAGRRLDVVVGDKQLDLAEFDRVLRATTDTVRPAEVPEQIQVGGALRTDMLVVDISAGFTPTALGLIRFARRLRFVPADDTSLALTQLVAIAAVRGRAGLDRFPFLCDGSEPAQMPVGEDGVPEVPGVCLHTLRRAAEELRRERRGDTRDAVTDFVEPSPRQKLLMQAAGTDLRHVLRLLGSVQGSVEVEERDEDGNLTGKTVSVEAWRCPQPQNHTNGDATPSARILPTYDETPGFRCFRCLPERVDALRLVMWALNLSVDEAADWLLRNQP